MNSVKEKEGTEKVNALYLASVTSRVHTYVWLSARDDYSFDSSRLLRALSFRLKWYQVRSSSYGSDAWYTIPHASVGRDGLYDTRYHALDLPSNISQELWRSDTQTSALTRSEPIGHPAQVLICFQTMLHGFTLFRFILEQVMEYIAIFNRLLHC
jgi:hypothetical protein